MFRSFKKNSASDWRMTEKMQICWCWQQNDRLRRSIRFYLSNKQQHPCAAGKPVQLRDVQLFWAETWAKRDVATRGLHGRLLPRYSKPRGRAFLLQRRKGRRQCHVCEVGELQLFVHLLSTVMIRYCYTGSDCSDMTFLCIPLGTINGGDMSGNFFQKDSQKFWTWGEVLLFSVSFSYFVKFSSSFVSNF